MARSRERPWRASVPASRAHRLTDPPAPGTVWRANVGRSHLLPRGQVDRSIWSSTPRSTAIDDEAVWGEIVF